MGYKPNSSEYGRLKPIVSSNLSFIKRNVKTEVLKVVNQFTTINFLELYFKACHTIIVRSLIQLPPLEKNKLPLTDQLWPTMVKEFRDSVKKKILKSLSSNPTYKKAYLNGLLTNFLDNNGIKSFCKIQWYKGLNGGSRTNPSESLGNLIKPYGSEEIKNVQTILKGMPSLNLLIYYQNQLNKNNHIYLPTKKDPFDTKTLSKGSKRVGGSTMSMLLSNCKIVLILFLFITLGEFSNLLPISYEADGFLVAGYFTDDEKENLLEEIHLILKKKFKAL